MTEKAWDTYPEHLQEFLEESETFTKEINRDKRFIRTTRILRYFVMAIVIGLGVAAVVYLFKGDWLWAAINTGLLLVNLMNFFTMKNAIQQSKERIVRWELLALAAQAVLQVCDDRKEREDDVRP